MRRKIVCYSKIQNFDNFQHFDDLFGGTLKRRQDNEHNDTQHNNIWNNTLIMMIFYTIALHNDTQHNDYNDIHRDTQYNGIQHNNI